MDEVDQIILSSLKESGYITNDILTNIKSYPFDEVVKMAIHCFKNIQPESDFPSSLPPIMSLRYSVCARFAQLCKDLGYKGEVGYHTFMYKNYEDIRKVLIFLVEHLPKKVTFQESEDSESSKNITVKRKVSEELKRILASSEKNDHFGMCKIPFISVFLETGALLPEQKIDCKPLEWKDFVVKELPFIDDQLPDHRYWLPSVISLNSDGIVHPKKSKCSKFSPVSPTYNYFKTISMQSHQRSFQLDNNSRFSSIEDKTGILVQDMNNVNITEAQKANESQCLKEILPSSSAQSEDHAAVTKLEEERNEIKSNINTLSIKLTEITEKIEISRQKLEEKRAENTALEQSLQLLPESKSNIPQLEVVNERCREKIKKMNKQWIRHRTLLEATRTELKKTIETRIELKNSLLHQITEIRKELFDVVEQIEKRKTVEERLAEYSKSVSGVQRKDHIHRILEIIKSLKKQETQIIDILNDLKCIQKEINTLSGKVERSFNLTEQLITANLHLDEFSQETHKLVLKIHQDISEVLTMIVETGNYLRETKDLEDQIVDNANHVTDALRQITIDIGRLKEEQNEILKEIQRYDKTFKVEPKMTEVATPSFKKILRSDIYGFHKTRRSEQSSTPRNSMNADLHKGASTSKNND